MTEPGDISGHGIAAHLPEPVEAILPDCTGQAEIVDFSRQDQDGFTVDEDLFVAIGRRHGHSKSGQTGRQYFRLWQAGEGDQ
jgi:hypothetical protein